MGAREIRSLVDERRHWAYFGSSMSGKTTLARWHARILARANYHVIVFDPVMTETKGGGWPEDASIFTDAQKFVAYMNRAQFTEEDPAFVFVDESADIFPHDIPETHWMLRRGRHRYFYMRLIVQRPKMVAPNVRNQCTRVFMFRVSRQDAREICADVGHSSDVADTELDEGDCLMLQSGSAAIEKFNCFALVN